MRIDRPYYRKLPACAGLSYEEIDRLTKEVFRRKPRLLVVRVLAALLEIPVLIWAPRPLGEWLGVSFMWALTITAAVFVIPLWVYETWFHRPRVNAEMEAILAESDEAACGEG
jgi:hypothetical protein